MIFAFLGTFISICLIGLTFYVVHLFGLADSIGIKESLAFGSIISATDPVIIISVFKESTPDLNFYSILFGESILNDAFCIVFYDTVYNFEGSSAFGDLAKGLGAFLLAFFGSIVIGWITGFFTGLVNL